MPRPKKPAVDLRRHPRSKEFARQKLQLEYAETDSSKKQCEATLWDFSEGGLGMDAPRPFEPGSTLAISAQLRGDMYSMKLDATARVAYCRRTDVTTYRVGVAFIEVSLHRIAAAGA